jgi:hypothetical protein
LNASADMLWPEAPDVSLYSSTNTFNEQDAGQPQPIEIEYGSPVSGSLGDDNDFIGSDGVTHFDRYHFVVQETPKPYVITLHSPEFSAASTLVYVDEAQQKLLPLQSAFVWAPDGQVQYSGQLTTSGNYFIDVLANDGNNGTYTITLGETIPDPIPGACSNADPKNPVIESPVGTTLNCELTTQDLKVKSNKGEHYAKLFHVKSQGTLTINANSSAFTPMILLYDPQSKQITDQGEGSLTVQASGDVYYFVTSAEPDTTGAFTVLVAEPNNNSSFNTDAYGGVEYDLSKFPVNIERR